MHTNISAESKKILENIDKVCNYTKVLFSNKTENTTDFSLCLKIADKLIDFTDINCTVYDSTCGKGSFLLACIKRFLEHGHDIDIIMNKVIHGGDISASQLEHCKTNLIRATGVEPINIKQENALNTKKKFTYELGNYPFNDSSENENRDTNKLKENTGDLDYELYLNRKNLADKRAVIIRSSCLAKSTKIRKDIMLDPNVYSILDTSKSFNIIHETMAVFSDNKKTSIEKEVIDCNDQSWFLDTDEDTKFSPSILAINSSKLFNCLKLAKESNFGELWTRSNILRSDKGVNDTNGIDFVETTGKKDEQLILRKYNGQNSLGNINHYRICTNTNATGKWTIGTMKIVKPGVVLSNSMVSFAFSTLEEAKKQLQYLESDFVTFIAKSLHVTQSNSSEFFAFVPYIKNITKKKIKELNESVKN